MPGPPNHRPPPDDLIRSALGRAAGRAGPDCLDAETLAAFYEHTLDADAFARAEAHVAGCLDCQEALVALARSEPEPAAPAAGARAAWFPWRLAWAAPVLVALLAVAVWYTRPPDLAPRQDAIVASRAVAGEEAVAPAEAERPVAEAPKAGAPAAPPAAARPRRADEPTAGAAVAEPPPAALEKTEEPRAEPRAAARQTATLGALAADTAASLVAAPGGRIVWRLGPGRAIARSDDGGATWRDQGPVDGEPLAGAAPALTVCWAAGRAGAVWRTTDGERWEKVSVPAGADLVAIEATGADQAIVTAEDGRRWETVDGGRTWFEKGDGGIFR